MLNVSLVIVQFFQKVSLLNLLFAFLLFFKFQLVYLFGDLLFSDQNAHTALERDVGPEIVELFQTYSYFLFIVVAGLNKRLLSLELLPDSVLSHFKLFFFFLLQHILLKTSLPLQFADSFILSDVSLNFGDAFKQFIVSLTLLFETGLYHFQVGLIST